MELLGVNEYLQVALRLQAGLEPLHIFKCAGIWRLHRITKRFYR